MDVNGKWLSSLAQAGISQGKAYLGIDLFFSVNQPVSFFGRLSWPAKSYQVNTPLFLAFGANRATIE